MLTITNDTPIRTIASCIFFQAMDPVGPFELWVDRGLWERLLSEAPCPADDGDRRDHALGMIEATVHGVEPVTAPSGLRVLMV